jgi:hypothetical protein
MIVMMLQDNGTNKYLNKIWTPFNWENLDQILCIIQYQYIMDTELKKILSALFIHYNQNHLNKTWRRFSNKTCMYWDLNQNWSQLNLMMRIDLSLFHSIVEMILFKYMKYVIKIREELEVNLWKERNIRILLIKTTMKKKTFY